MTSTSDEKWRPFNGFSVQGTGSSPVGPDPGNRVGDQDIRSPGRPVSSPTISEVGRAKDLAAPPHTHNMMSHQDTVVLAPSCM
jgi:hypothetical protein